jgi:hypothetical protein
MPSNQTKPTDEGSLQSTKEQNLAGGKDSNSTDERSARPTAADDDPSNVQRNAGNQHHGGVANAASTQGASQTVNFPQIEFFAVLLERCRPSLEEVIVNVHERLGQRTNWQKFRDLIKDLGPIVTSSAAVFVTLAIGITTCDFNKRQEAIKTQQETLRQADLKRSWLADFTDSDDAKRKVGAIKLAAYGAEALPAIKDALSISKPNEPINEGGRVTAMMIFRSQPTNRPLLLNSTLNWVQDGNATLRLSVLWFYVNASNELSSNEKSAFLEQLKKRLGVSASNCPNEDGEFVLHAATFLTKGPFPEAKGLLLDIARSCPHEKTEYEGARRQAVRLLPDIVNQQRLQKPDRDAIILALQGLEADASEGLKAIIQTAIESIAAIP